MKARKKAVRRQVFVLTPDEKRAAACVIGAFLLGLGTMYYRSQNPRPPPPASAAEQREAKRATTGERAERTLSSRKTAPASSPRDTQRRDGAEDGE